MRRIMHFAKSSFAFAVTQPLAKSSRSLAANINLAPSLTSPQEASSLYGPQASFITAGMMLRMQQSTRAPAGQRPVLTESESASVSQCVFKMHNNDSSSLLLLSDSDGSTVAGLLTQRDYLRTVVLRGVPSENVNAIDIATIQLTCALPRYSLDQMLRLYVEHFTQHVPIVSKSANEKSNVTIDEVHGTLSMADTAWVLWSVLSHSRDEFHPWTSDSPSPPADNIADMSIQEVLDLSHPGGESALTVSASDTVLNALKIMDSHKVGGLIVKDENNRNSTSGSSSGFGIFTELDYLNEVHVKGRHSSETLVHEIMTPNPRCVTLDSSVDVALKEMILHKCRHLPIVVTGKGTIGYSIGKILSFGDIFRALTDRVERASRGTE
jgi:CBS domain-containing protein